MKRKKYITGTGVQGIIDYMPSPSEVLAEDSINKAKAQADAADNPWAMGVQILGGLASNYVSKGDLADESLQQTGFGKFATKNFANGGIVNSPNMIEAEGGEIVETPGGMPVELDGPSHANGGIDLAVPTGTRIFSDQLKIGGKTMSERKQTRDNRRKKIEDLLEDNVADLALKNTKNRTLEILDSEEEQDLMYQQVANMANTLNEFANGTGPGGVNLNDFLSNLLGGEVPVLRPNTDTVPPSTLPDLGTPLSQPFMSNSANYLQDQEALATEWFAPDSTPLAAPTPTPKIDPQTGLSTKLGDVLGIGGDIISTFGPLINTLNARGGDTPNINAFEGFGQDALVANSDAQTYIQDQRDNAGRRIRNNANTSKRSARNSARGINTQRALDLAIDAGVNEAEVNANDVFTRQMMDLLGQRSGLLNQRDATVMQGEQNRDTADRQDRDNFYTQKGRDISTLGRGVQQIGKDVNNISEQEQYMTLLNQLSKYFIYDSKGNLVPRNQTT